jgi:SAM-dependent methyltransferase
MTHDYARLYEKHARDAGDPKASIGEGDFESVGRAELAVLKSEGLRPDGALLDFGCGVGRLALQAIPYLASGRYVGLDISPTMIRGARELARERLPAVPASRYRFEVNEGEEVSRFGDGFDMVCAYSVFTHMESEDTYRYTVALAKALRPGGKLVCSVLPLETDLARQVFLREAALPPAERWQRVRNVATSYEMMERIATMAGLQSFRWYRGDEIGIRLDDGTLTSLGQSALVGVKP